MASSSIITHKAYEPVRQAAGLHVIESSNGHSHIEMMGAGPVETLQAVRLRIRRLAWCPAC